MLYRLFELLDLVYYNSAYVFFGMLVLFSIYSLFTMNSIKLNGWRYREINDFYLKIISREIDDMSPSDFEDFVAYLFKKMNYDVKSTGKTRDGGKDLVLGNDTYVEIKHYSEGNLVGRPIIQRLIGCCSENNIKNGIIVTTSAFTKEAYDCMQKSKDVNINFMYKDDLLNMCETINSTEILEWLGYDKKQITETYQW